MEERKRHRLLQVVSVAVAALMAAANVAFLSALALEAVHSQRGRRGGNGAFSASDIAWLAIGVLAVAALAVLVALPLRFHGNKPVRTLGYAGCGCLGISAFASGTFMLALLTAQGLGADLGSMLPLTVVAGLSSLGAAILLFMKSRAGEEEER